MVAAKKKREATADAAEADDAPKVSEYMDNPNPNSNPDPNPNPNPNPNPSPNPNQVRRAGPRGDTLYLPYISHISPQNL